MPELVVLTEQLLAPVPGGTGRYTYELAGALARNAPTGWRVTGVVAKHRDVRPAVIPGVEGPKMLPLPRRMISAMWARGIPVWPGGDSLHAPTPFAPPGAPPGRGLVVTVHDTVPWTHPHTLTPHGVSWHRRVINRSAQKANALVVPTAAVAAELSQYVTSYSRVHVIGEGVSPEVLKDIEPESADEIGRRLGLPPQYVLAIGTVEPRKGLDVLIEALSRNALDLPLVVIGPTGWGGVDLKALALRHGLHRDRLRILGKVTDAELAVALRRAAVLAMPSLAEGFGLPLLEAMAVGVPVVHSDAPALVEVAGGAGLVVRRNDPAALAAGIRTVLEHPERTARMVESARKRAAKFTWDRAAESVWQLHLELYQSLRTGLR